MRSTALFIATLLGIGLSALVLGFAAGKLLHDPQQTALARASGACIAFEMAAAHGAIDELERRKTLRAPESTLNPRVQRLPERTGDVISQCARLTKGAVRSSVTA